MSVRARLFGLFPAVWLILVLLAAIVVWLQLSFGYRIGKDMAERDNRSDCREASGTDCP